MKMGFGVYVMAEGIGPPHGLGIRGGKVLGFRVRYDMKPTTLLLPVMTNTSASIRRVFILRRRNTSGFAPLSDDRLIALYFLSIPGTDLQSPVLEHKGSVLCLGGFKGFTV